MPLPNAEIAPLRIGIVGDSHIASAKKTVDANYQPPTDFPVKIDFFGARGPMFRELKLKSRRLVPTQALLNSGDLISTSGISELTASSFDAVLFLSARLRSNTVFEALLPGQIDPTVARSEAVQELVVSRMFETRRAARTAAMLARTGMAFVAFAPTPFFTKGIPADTEFPGGVAPTDAGPEHREPIWQLIEKGFAKRGVTFLRQPEDTIVDGCLTDPIWAIDGASDKKDPVHKSPAYTALLLDAFFRQPGLKQVWEQRAKIDAA